MQSIYWLALCGAGGAIIYGLPVYFKQISQIPPEKLALAQLALVVFVGALCAAILTNFIGHRWPWTVQPEPYPLALVIGIASNSLIPILLEKLKGAAAGFNIGVGK